MALVEPSPEYSATKIIEESYHNKLINDGIFKPQISKWILYPLASQLGIKYIERQLKKGVWRACKSEDLCAEIRSSG